MQVGRRPAGLCGAGGVYRNISSKYIIQTPTKKSENATFWFVLSKRTASNFIASVHHLSLRFTILTCLALLIAARMHGFVRTQRDVVDVVRVCGNTIRKRYIMVLVYTSVDLHSIAARCKHGKFGHSFYH